MRQNIEESVMKYTVGFGTLQLNDESYFSINFYPQYKHNNLSFGFNFDPTFTFSGELLNNDWDDAFDFIDRFYVNFYHAEHTKNNEMYLHYGKINNLSFAQGYLLKNFNNSFDYPRMKNSGLHINYKFDNESLQSKFTSTKNEGIEIVKKHLINESIKEFIKLISKYENEARITIDLSDDIIELTTVLPGYLISSNADSSFNDTLLWRFSGIDLIDEDYIISAKTSIYHKSRFHWTILTIILLIASITLYLIARKVPDPMKMSK